MALQLKRNKWIDIQEKLNMCQGKYSKTSLGHYKSISICKNQERALFHSNRNEIVYE